MDLHYCLGRTQKDRKKTPIKLQHLIIFLVVDSDYQGMKNFMFDCANQTIEIDEITITPEPFWTGINIPSNGSKRKSEGTQYIDASFSSKFFSFQTYI